MEESRKVWGPPLMSSDEMMAARFKNVINDGDGIIKTLIDRELDRKRATFPTLDIRLNKDGTLLRHIEPWGSLCLTSAEQDVTITPCRCDEKRPEEGKPPSVPEEWFS